MPNMLKALSYQAVVPSDQFVIAKRVTGLAAEWRVIESQPDANRARHARDVLAAHGVKVGEIAFDDDIRIFPSSEVTYV